MEKSKYKIAYLTSVDPLDKKSLSGTIYTILKVLEKDVGTVDVLGPVKITNALLRFLKRVNYKLQRRYNFNHSLYYGRIYARIFEKKLKGKDYDFIFAQRSSVEICKLKTDIPIIYYTDTTFKLFYNYYEWFSNFMKISVKEGNIVEQLAINNSALTICSSQWAADSVIQHYHAKPENVFIIPFGPNVDELPGREMLYTEKDRIVCKMLFIGIEWERKGGEIAFETLKELKKRGIKSRLTICGCKPPEEFQDEDLVVIPFLNKNDKAQSDLFNQLLFENHFFILPTRAECFGVVFCEASAFGLPSITTDTGGIGSAVENGKNGFRLSLEARGDKYADVISEIFSDYDNKYLPLIKSTRDFYETRLSWKSWASSLNTILENHKQLFYKSDKK